MHDFPAPGATNNPGLDTTFSNSSISGLAAGTAYSLTNTAALVDFGTTDPAITVNLPGTYILMGRARVDYAAATFAAVRTVTFKLRRSNNTPSDISGTSSSFLTQIITALSFTALTVNLPPVVYTTTNADDVIQLWGSVSAVPTAGTIDVTEASVVAIRLS